MLFLILKSSILAVHFSSELTKRWNLSALAFTWFCLNQFNRELVDFSYLLPRSKSNYMVHCRPHNLQFHILLCQKISHRYRYSKVRSWLLTTKGTFDFCCLLSIRKKTLNDSETLVFKIIGSRFSYQKVVQNSIKGFWEICYHSSTYTPFAQTFLSLSRHHKKIVLCAKAFTESTLPFCEYMIEIFIHLIV